MTKSYLYNNRMKIKSNKNQHYTSQTKKHSHSINSPTKSVNQSSQQVCLPSELVFYRELVEQLGIQSRQERIRFRNNFKQKYQKHLQLVYMNQINMDKFRQSHQKQQLSKQVELEEKRGQLESKQNQAKQRKIKETNKNLQRAELEHEKWRSVVEKNKNQYLKNIKNSMKLIKRWQNKLTSSAAKRSQILHRITEQTKQHNEYVNAVSDKNKIQLSLQAEYNIMKLEESLSMRLKTGKRKTQKSQDGYSYLNPEIIKYQTPSKEQRRRLNIVSRAKTFGSQNKMSQDKQSRMDGQSNKKSPRGHSNSQFQINKDNEKSTLKLSKLSKSSSDDHLNLKQAIDLQIIEQSLCKNIEKQHRIVEARNIKSYLHQQRNKQNRQRQQLTKLKIMENLQKLKQQNLQRNRKLDEKYQQSRVRMQTRIASPKRCDRNNQEMPNISLPTIKNKVDILQYSIPEYESLNFKNNGSKLPAINYHRLKINKFNLEQEKDGVYITEGEMGRKGQKQSKYNKKIMQKLRSLSLVANIKARQRQKNGEKTSKAVGKKIGWELKGQNSQRSRAAINEARFS